MRKVLWVFMSISLILSCRTSKKPTDNQKTPEKEQTKNQKKDPSKKPVLRLSPTDYDFGHRDIGSKHDHDIYAINDSNVSISSQIKVRNNSDEIKVKTCDRDIDPKGICRITITITPKKENLQFDHTISLDYKALNQKAIQTSTFKIKGQIPADLLMSSPGQGNFGQVPVGTVSQKTLTITNTSKDYEVQIEPFKLDAFAFRFVGNKYPGTGGSCSDSLAPSSSCKIILETYPRIFRHEAVDIQLKYKYPKGSSRFVIYTFKSQGVQHDHIQELEIRTPNQVPFDFGQQSILDQKKHSQIFTIKNITNYFIHIESSLPTTKKLTVKESSNDSCFFPSFDHQELGKTHILPPGDECSFEVILPPTGGETAGNYSEELSFNYYPYEISLKTNLKRTKNINIHWTFFNPPPP